MPLFEIETDSHIIITWAKDTDDASAVVAKAYPQDNIIRLTKRPRDTWVISKSALGISDPLDLCNTARDPPPSPDARVSRLGSRVMNAAELAVRRERVFDVGAELFCDEPIGLVRGEGVHLYDAYAFPAAFEETVRGLH